MLISIISWHTDILDEILPSTSKLLSGHIWLGRWEDKLDVCSDYAGVTTIQEKLQLFVNFTCTEETLGGKDETGG